MNTGWRKLIASARARIGALCSNTRGSTLAICAAAIIPLLLLMGSGLDMSRAYMAKLRLQQACDAGSLAGRRVMQGDTLDADLAGGLDGVLAVVGHVVGVQSLGRDAAGVGADTIASPPSG